MILMMILPYTVYALAGQERWCCLLCSCRPGAVGVAFYARADQERCAMQFWAHVGEEPCVLQFRLLQTRSFGVAFYACADEELWFVQFRLVRTRSIVSYSLGSCGQGALCPTV
ncbi:hypothetical protein EV2_027849 [Malus domestica]